VIGSSFITIKFQEGDIKDGVNGATYEDVIQVILNCIERDQSKKKTNTRGNAMARLKLDEAILWLNKK